MPTNEYSSVNVSGNAILACVAISVNADTFSWYEVDFKRAYLRKQGSEETVYELETGDQFKLFLNRLRKKML